MEYSSFVGSALSLPSDDEAGREKREGETRRLTMSTRRLFKNCYAICLNTFSKFYVLVSSFLKRIGKITDLQNHWCHYLNI